MSQIPIAWLIKIIRGVSELTRIFPQQVNDMIDGSRDILLISIIYGAMIF